jgi:hypothetical protein
MRVISSKASRFRIIPARRSAPDWRLKLGKLGAHHFENGFGKRRVCHLLHPGPRPPPVAPVIVPMP